MIFYSMNNNGTFGPAAAVLSDGSLVVVPEELTCDEVTAWGEREEQSSSPYELAKMFPEAQKELKQMIKERKAELNELSEVAWSIENHVRKQCKKYSDQEFMKEVYMGLHVDIPQKRLLAEIKKLEDVVFNIEMSKKTGVGEDRRHNVEMAKAVAISNFIEFNHAGFAKCVWHTEKTPSMKYYEDKNRVHCFGGCGKSGDVIDVVGQLYNIKFLEAVNFILHK